ncbi:hypothetical protein Csa_000196 [Cucumis sativus]|nr:hypothetical protein Csa_000196 [Cucumis sativus]
MENTDNNALSILSREKLDQVAAWVAATMSSAFFSSLERFSCVHVATNELDDDDDDDDHLLLSTQPLSDQILLPDQHDGYRICVVLFVLADIYFIERLWK